MPTWLQRCSDASGIKGDAYYNPIYEPIWAAAEDLNLLMSFTPGSFRGVRRDVGLKVE